jgi:hypothetical protein
LQDKASSARQQGAFRIGASFLPAWKCAPQLGRITLNHSLEARFDGAGSFPAKAYRATWGIVSKTRGRPYGLRSKEQWVAAKIMHLYPDLPDGLDVGMLHRLVNIALVKDEDYKRARGKKPLCVTPKTVRRTLKKLRDLKARGELPLP